MKDNEDKIPDASGLVTKTGFGTKIKEVKYDIVSFDENLKNINKKSLSINQNIYRLKMN